MNSDHTSNMAKQTQHRCLKLFLNAIGSDVTKKGYTYQLDRFLKWNKIKSGNYDDLLKADEKAIQRNLEDYLIHLKDQQLSPNYIPTIIAPIELFYLMNEVNVNSKRLHKMFPTKVKKGGYGAYKREDIQLMLDNTNKKRTKSIILFLSSTGCRVGVLPDLKLKHITNYEYCKRVLCYAETVDEYCTFMTPEASLAFDNYLEERQQDKERLTDESPAFRKDYVLGSSPAEPMQTGTIRNALYVTLKDVKRARTGSRFNIPIVHGLRKYFNVTMKSMDNCNISKCEKLMGHSVTVQLDNSYAPFTDEKLFEEYKKVIPELTISNDERDKVKIQELENEKSELESERESNNSLKKELTEMKQNMDENIRHGMQKHLESVKKEFERSQLEREKLKQQAGENAKKWIDEIRNETHTKFEKLKQDPEKLKKLDELFKLLNDSE